MNSTTGGAFERSIDVDEAIERGLGYLDQRGIRCELSAVGNGIETSYCLLQGDVPLDVAPGTGKGLGRQSSASALYEAIEHLCWFEDALPDADASVLLDLFGEDHALKRASPDFERIGGGRQLYFSRVEMTSFLDPSVSLAFPFFLSNPFFAGVDARESRCLSQFGFSRYGTNSGTAAATVHIDALLHALLENIERDAISIELLRTIVAVPPRPTRRLEIDSLPERLKACIADIETDSAKVTVWDITTDIGVPAMLASVYDSCRGCQYFGSGCSLMAEYAVERAVLEGLQLLHSQRLGRLPSTAADNLSADAPSLLRCRLESGFFGFRGGEITVPLDRSAKPIHGLYVADQVDELVRRLDRRGMKTYYRTIVDDVIAVVQVVVPELERFHLVSCGIPVIPSFRGRSLMEME